jgi:salicylate hydroxylase
MRAVIPAAAAGRLAATDVGLWLGAGANVVHYPVRAGTEIAIVVIAREAWPAGGGDVAVAGARALSVLAAFHPALTEALAAAPEWRKWSLHLLAKRPRWCMGRIGLIGDAAHPMLPHLAQGGALALEDALVLGALLGEEGADVAASFRRFEAERRGRAQSIAAHSHRNGVIYHLGPPLAWARNGVLRLLPGAWLMAGYDLIYGWRPNGRGTARWQQTVSGL